jgi:hypothetical protein
VRAPAALRAASLATGLCVALPAFAAEETIALSDSLAANADALTVKVGGQGFGKISKYQIGDYAVASSKLASTHIDEKSNFLKTKFERHSITKFSFVMQNASPGSVSVEAVRHAMDASTHEFKITKSVGVGSNELLEQSDSCTATIVVQVDTTETWSLLKRSSTVPELQYEAYLSNGTRKVFLVPVRGAPRGDGAPKKSLFTRMVHGVVPLPIGYEFVENGQAIAALQTFGGMSTKNSQRAWMDRRLDPRSRLLLAAAMTTVLQVESSNTGLEPPDEEE